MHKSFKLGLAFLLTLAFGGFMGYLSRELLGPNAPLLVAVFLLASYAYIKVTVKVGLVEDKQLW